MLHELDYLRELNMAAIILKLSLSMLVGGILGLNRTRKGRAAGFRTYMLVCLGSTLTMLMSQYFQVMSLGPWQPALAETGLRLDLSRLGAQVINGIGFLGAGTILVVGSKKVLGLTTAAGLWAAACLGLAIGAGFYEAVLMLAVLIFTIIRFLPALEDKITENSRYMNIYIETAEADTFGQIIKLLKANQITILDVDIQRKSNQSGLNPNAIFSIYIHSKESHVSIISKIGTIEDVLQVDEI